MCVESTQLLELAPSLFLARSLCYSEQLLTKSEDKSAYYLERTYWM